MIQSLYGKKIGMTQVFSSNNKVVPVTVVDFSSWKVLQIKTIGHDGYDALQIGCLRSKYSDKEFNIEWLKKKKEHFLFVKEICVENVSSFQAGAEFTPSFLSEGLEVDITGKTIGKGFQGGVKRHGFTGGRASHGGKLGRKCGSLSGLRTCGKVFKGKKMPGHMGAETRTMKNLKVVRIDQENKIMLIKGSVPGKIGSILCIKNQRR